MSLRERNFQMRILLLSLAFSAVVASAQSDSFGSIGLTSIPVTRSFKITDGEKTLATSDANGAIEIAGKCEDIVRVVRDSMLQTSQASRTEYADRLHYEQLLKREIDLLNDVIASQKKQIAVLQEGLRQVRTILKGSAK